MTNMTKQTQVRSTEEAMKLALEALEEIHPGNMTPLAEEAWKKAITALREALTSVPDWASEAKEQPAQPQQEPVAVIGSNFQLLWCREDWSKGLRVGDFLYTSPPAQPQQEPVAELVVSQYSGGKRLDIEWNLAADVMAFALGRLPLYTSPPTLSLAQRQARSADTWVELTNEEINEFFEGMEPNNGFWLSFARAIEAKLKEKNSD